MWIEEMATKIVAAYSCDIEYFNENRCEIIVKDGNDAKKIIFDRTSFYVYEKNFSEIDKQKVFEIVSKIWDSPHNPKEKERIERLVLNEYILINKKLIKYKILKEERPDFILTNKNEKIGIEIVELTTQKDKIMNKICLENFKGISPGKAKEKMIKKHGEKAKEYNYFELNGSIVIESRPFLCESKSKIYTEEIIIKYNKYKEEMKKYNKFIILCNATGFEINNEDSLTNIIKELKDYDFKTHFKIEILYNENGVIRLKTINI